VPVVNPGGEGNRNLADFTSVALDQNGCAVFTYGDDGAIMADQSNFDFSLVSNDVTRQTGGCFATAAAASTPTPSPSATPTATAAPISSLPNTGASACGHGTATALSLAALLGAASLGAARRRRRTRLGRR
jgi:hypothetical protein